MTQCRKIIHIDMDAFYASVEQRDHPELKGKPVIVGGLPDSRGVVAACSYEARKFGIHSAMPSSHAYRLCPNSIFIRPRFDAYKAVSQEINQIFKIYSDLVEPLSLDEAFLDVTNNKKGILYATTVAQNIRKEIFDKTKLTASAGVSFNKFIAKVASDFNKPNGITVVTPNEADLFLESLPIGKFFGVGKVTKSKMNALGIYKGADLKKFSKNELISNFGKAGSFFYDIVRGIDSRPVITYRRRKSIGKETTLIEDINDHQTMLNIIRDLTYEVSERLIKYNLFARTLTLKVKYYNFEQVTRSVSFNQITNNAEYFLDHLPALLKTTDAGKKKVRLLGVSVSNLNDSDSLNYYQLSLPFNI